jgi:F-type H+-transporting ATPase subunit gamma
MASEKLIKRRIKSAKNIAQITKAMQMVAASKMKKAQQLALSGRPYAEKIAEMVSTFVKKIDQGSHPLLTKNETGKTLIILISTNKGLCGGLNSNLFRSFRNWFSQETLQEAVCVTLGRKGEQFLIRSKGNLIADFSDKKPFSQNIPALTTLITEGYLKKEYKEVYVVYNNFVSALSQEPTRKRILPISAFESVKKEELKEEKENDLEFVIEPSIDQILDVLLFHYLENQIRDSILEAEASEYSAQMIAMKNATDNALELIDLLTLEYNKARQEKITFEIADMVTARLAVE